MLTANGHMTVGLGKGGGGGAVAGVGGEGGECACLQPTVI